MLPNIIYRKIFSYVKIGELKKYIFLSRSICRIVIELYELYKKSKYFNDFNFKFISLSLPPVRKLEITDEIIRQAREHNERANYIKSLTNEKREQFFSFVHDVNPYA